MGKTTRKVSGRAGDTTPRRARRQALDVENARRPHLIIAGAGMVGLSLALALDQASQGAFAITLVDPVFGSARRADGRSSAIAAGARRMLTQLGAWPQGAQPIVDMIVTDSRLEDGVRPVFLNFAGEAAEGEPFAHMMENEALMAQLERALARSGIAKIAASIIKDERNAGRAALTLDDGQTLTADVILACDGARSRLREAAGIRLVGWDYDQSGIVATLIHQEPHGGRAEEHFLEAGPFAILPLADDSDGQHRSSLVWTEKSAEARRLVELDDEAFHAALIERFGRHLGEVRLAGKRSAYPLAMKMARRFVAQRLALVGDAAHIIHPIAGQGLNLGFRDAAALCQVLIEAFRLGEDIGALDVLERYERWRRFDTVAMGLTTDGLNRLFSNDIGPLRALRDLGLGIVDRLPRLKSAFIANAAGLVGDIPKLMRGEAI